MSGTYAAASAGCASSGAMLLLLDSAITSTGSFAASSLADGLGPLDASLRLYVERS